MFCYIYDFNEMFVNMVLNVALEWLSLLLCILEVLGSKLGRRQVVLTEVLRGLQKAPKISP
jgi:hypothetical protein